LRIVHCGGDVMKAEDAWRHPRIVPCKRADY
jgi:hypothetical protein